MAPTTALHALAIKASAAEFRAALGDEALLNRGLAAAFLGVSERTIDYFCAMARGQRRINRTVRGEKKRGRIMVPASRQKLSHFKIGHKDFFQLGELRRFRDERKVAA